ncbi:MAG TPA: DUF72 domain-containing protein [Acidobacteriota bacterium]|nr:DUF72 domain-containing protein [Acidobacteriota bacterium]
MSLNQDKRIYVGTSGYSYREWRKIFYPADLAPANYLSFYADRFPTTEINNTFYRFPSEAVASSWNEQVPRDFRFSVKLNQKITHQKKLADVEEEMQWFQKGIAPLREKIAAVLVQLPPYLRQDLSVLDEFITRYGRSLPLAFEFRHASWHTPELYDLLAERNAVLVMAETEEAPAVRETTGSFVYLRLRKARYEPGELEAWAQWLRQQRKSCFVYLKHDQQAPVLASQLLESLQGVA